MVPIYTNNTNNTNNTENTDNTDYPSSNVRAKIVVAAVFSFFLGGGEEKVSRRELCAMSTGTTVHRMGVAFQQHGVCSVMACIFFKTAECCSRVVARVEGMGISKTHRNY